MTLDLGFAPLRFDGGLEAGIIDVPGHERFIHNMLAGAAGIDVVLLVVDAVEGPRAQTLEHLEILGLLDVKRAIVVMTKADLVSDDRRESVRAEVEIACAGTIAQGAPLVWVSNLTGEGIEDLKALIHEALAGLSPPRLEAPAFLPVDRAFALPGHGTIVTGTLLQGSIRHGETLAVQPAGTPARIRSLEIFGRKTEQADAGARVALNIPGIDVTDVKRGDVLTAPREFEPVRSLEVLFHPLRRSSALLRRRTPVRVHVGSAEIEGRLLLRAQVDDAQPVAATIELVRPTVTYPGARLIVRRLSPKDLLGGAVVLAPAQTDTGSPDVDSDLSLDDAHPHAGACLAAIEAAGLHPVSVRRVASSANVREADAAAAIDALAQHGRIAALEKPAEYVSRAAFEDAFARAASALRERHATAPWRLGCSAGEIAAALAVDDALAVRLLAAWQHDGRVAQRARYWCLPGFVPALRKDQRAFFEGQLAGDAAAPLLPASFDALMRHADASKIGGIREAFESLMAAGALARVGDDVYRARQLERARSTVATVLADGAAATTSTLREKLGISRKHALPLLEHFDAVGLTVRDGDVRRLRSRTGTERAPVKVR